MNALDLLKEMVAIPSMNPMGRFAAEPPYCEKEMAAFTADAMRKAGLDVEVYDVEPNRPNVVGWFDAHAERTVMLEAHMDTVHADGMEVDPFSAKVENGRLYGRGACDTKGSLAAFISAVSIAARKNAALPFNIIVAAAADEEAGFTGAQALIARGLKADMAVVGEPTQLHIVRAHKGVIRWKLATSGRAAHSAYPSRGRNAIYSMARILARLEDHADALSRMAPHPLLGVPSLSVGTIAGGQVVNIVPDRCTIEIDRRTLPGETEAQVLSMAREALAGLGDWTFEPPFLSVEGIDVPEDAPIVRRLSSAIEEVTGSAVVEAAHYATDAGHYNLAGIPSIVFGPGDIAQAHTSGEYLEIDQLERAVEIITRFLTAS